MCGIYCLCVVFFFFKQKTAYEVRISDWSSDVCSSDLAGRCEGALQVHLDDRVPLGLAHVREHAVAQDPGVVDEDVETTEGVDRGADEALGTVPVADVV